MFHSLFHIIGTKVGLQAPSRLSIIRNTQRHDNKQPNDLCIRQARHPSFLAPRSPLPEAHAWTRRLTQNRDGGLPASKFFARVHPRLGLPLNALILTAFVVIIFGCIYLGSSRYLPPRKLIYP